MHEVSEEEMRRNERSAVTIPAVSEFFVIGAAAHAFFCMLFAR